MPFSNVDHPTAQVSEESFRLLAETIPQLVWSANSKGILGYVNQQLITYMGIKENEDVATKWLEAIHPLDYKKAEKLWKESMIAGVLFSVDYRLRRYDDEYRWFKTRGTPIHDANGKVSWWVGTSTDIQDQMEALALRDDFISIASHELKTPITTLKLLSQMTLRTADSADSLEKVKSFAAQTERQLSRLTRLVDDMLDASRIRSGVLAITPEKMELGTLISEVIERMKVTFDGADQQLKFECKEKVEGYWDRFRIEQVLTNLLTNAMRYGKKQPVVVRLEKENGKARLSVQDQGMGIASENLEKIFNRFERSISANEVSGLGLGLFITRQIVSAHQGTICAESQGKDRGATFHIELPMSGGL